MRFVYCLLLLLSTSLQAAKNPVSYDELLLAYLKDQKSLDYATVVPEYARLWHAKAYADASKKSAGDSKVLLALLDPIGQELKRKVDLYDPAKLIVYGRRVNMGPYDQEKKNVPLSPVIGGGMFGVTTVTGMYAATLPAGFTVIFANYILPAQVLPFESKEKEEYFRISRMSILGKRKSRHLYAEVTIKQVRRIRDNQFLFWVNEVRYYESDKKQKVLLKWRETRSQAEVMKNHPLADGITLNPGPLHGFSILRKRLGEAALTAMPGWTGKNCTRRDDFHGHRQYFCSIRNFQNLLVGELSFVGGVLVAIQAIKPDIEMEARALATEVRILRQDYRMPYHPPDSPQEAWDYGGANFEYNVATGKQGSKKSRKFLSASHKRFLEMYPDFKVWSGPLEPSAPAPKGQKEGLTTPK